MNDMVHTEELRSDPAQAPAVVQPKEHETKEVDAETIRTLDPTRREIPAE